MADDYKFIIKSKVAYDKLYKIAYLKILNDITAPAGLYNLDHTFEFPCKSVTAVYNLYLKSGNNGTDTLKMDVQIRPDPDCEWLDLVNVSITGISTTDKTQYTDLINKTAGSLVTRLHLYGESGSGDTTTVYAGSWFQIILEGI